MGLTIKMNKMMQLFQYIFYCHIFRKLKVKKSFILNNISYNYFFHPHGSCFNERCVEIGMVLDKIKDYDSCDVLEVGNVLNEYIDIFHTVVDKYDKRTGIINEDIIDYGSDKRYKFIFSISTFEHIGYDEGPGVLLHDEDKVISCLDNVKSLLAKGGVLFVTMPIGYRIGLDDNIFDGRLGFDKEHFLKRVSSSNRWVEIDNDAAKDVMFNYPYSKANCIFVGEYVNKK